MRAYLDLLASPNPLPAAATPTAVAADPERAYLDLLASTASTISSPAAVLVAERPATSDEAAYLALISSDAPLVPDDAASAYLALLASDAPLTPADLLPEVATAAGRPRPRRTSHRAISPALLGARGQRVVMAAALIAGISVAGVGIAATASPSRADTTPVRTQTVSHTPTDPTADMPGTAAGRLVEQDPAYFDPSITEATPSGTPNLSSAKVSRKVKPKPIVAAAAWVNPMPQGSTTSCFGQRWGRLHAGVDLAAPSGTPIRSVGAGLVVSAGEAAGYGNAVLIDHGNGYLTHYAHMSAIKVQEGQRVKAGEQVGNEGSTGHSTGPHLHFEVHAGHYKNPIEPTAWLRTHGIEIPGCSTAADDDHKDD